MKTKLNILSFICLIAFVFGVIFIFDGMIDDFNWKKLIISGACFFIYWHLGTFITNIKIK